jgi:hypothetical protein
MYRMHPDSESLINYKKNKKRVANIKSTKYCNQLPIKISGMKHRLVLT